MKSKPVFAKATPDKQGAATRNPQPATRNSQRATAMSSFFGINGRIS
ncbi:MAG: hypothetical protein H8D96_07900 [Desulfobacterales bacterium]|uniref:Uncharacterized protein n=1 Tax=Candidatus Desulfatibia vada TaxID=2841696 RepID=A0A8J6NYK2_9BACT|nr:hypothetical protein [Candidatus Desulfatibia vada]MBL6972635.1 hypothetical protein [Desulfobacterales bacterium]